MSIVLLILGMALMTVVPYFLGGSNGAILVSKYILRDDIRDHGSGNAGLTNFLRVFGKSKLVVLVIGTDVIKAVISLLLGMLGAKLISLGGYSFMSVVLSKYIAGMFCELGHMFPVMFGFKGGKGVLSGGTIAIMISWKLALVVWGSFLILAVLTRYVSLGSVSTGVGYAIMAWVLYHDPVILVIAIITGGMLIWAHRGNIQRLLSGTESKFSIHKS